MHTITISMRIYRLLLKLYPSGFRNAYGRQMVAAFEQQRREHRYRAAVVGPLVFWFDILTDLSMSATRRRLAPRFQQARFPRKGETLMGILLQDLKYALRGLRQNPGVTTAALLTLAIGIGANTAMFSLVDGILLRPFPYPDPDRLVVVRDSNPGRGWDTFSVSPPNFIDYREQSTVFENLTASYNATTTLTGIDEPERLPLSIVAPDYFQTFGIEPQLGRAFSPEDNDPGKNNVVILSDRLWQRRFGANPEVLGETITLSGLPYTVVGVFTMPTDAPSYAELWLPEDFSPDNLGSRGAHYFLVIGRMKADITVERATGELRQIAARLEQEYTNTNGGWTAFARPLHEERVGNVRGSLMMLTGAVAFVLLIACANIANLLLARATGRQQEISVRVALGAGRGRIFSQVLNESLLLGLIGGGGGVLAAMGIVRAVAVWAPSNIPRLADVGIDGRVLGYTILLSIATGLLFGIVPALQSARADVNATLKQNGRAGSARKGMRGSLVVAEVALAVVVVVGAGLLMRSLWQMQAIDPGFEVENRVVARIGLPQSYDDPEQHLRFFEQLTTNLAVTPGIVAVAAAARLPMRGDFSISFTIQGRPDAPGDQGPSGEMRIVSPGYFGTLGIPLIRGRDFSASDRLDVPPVALINQRLADLYFPDEDPIGQRIRVGYAHARDAERVREIVGVVGNTREFGLGREPMPVYYVSYQQTPEPAMDMVINTSLESAGAVAALRREVGALDADIPVYSVRTLEQQVLDSTAPQRFRAVLLGSFASIALLLASIGIYGVMAYSVAQRRRELGIRMALGAAHGDVMGMVLKRGLTLSAAGVGIGALAAIGLARVMDGLLFGISPADPLTYGAVVLFLFVVAMIACYLPARRATGVDPTIAMRAE